jgi:16S rRNA (uracil1498-N3)-methyltransferase
VTTPPVFLVDALPDGPAYVLAGPEGHHAAAVRRLRPGETVQLSDGVGGLATCTVTAAGTDSLALQVVERSLAARPEPRFVVVQALAKGDRAELAVELMTELGVDKVIPWAATHSVVQWQGERGERALARLRATARAAAKQSRRAFVPDIAEPHGTRAVCGLIGAVVSPGANNSGGAAKPGTALILHAGAGTPLASVPVPAAGSVLLVVGPEGGLTEGELTAFRASGARPVRLGPDILRTSTAGAAALAVLAARSTRWA